MTPMMPDAPDPQNRMMGPPQGAPTPMPQGGPMMPGPNAMQGPQPAPGPAPTPDEIAQARKHVGAIMEGLDKITAVPRGKLTKKIIFDEAADMLAKGAFSTPEARQDLIVRLAGLPDDDPDLRKAMGQLRLSVAGHQADFHDMFGAS